MTEQQDTIAMSEYTYENLAEFAKSWAEQNDMDADMMHGILQMGINTYESTYSGYSLAMQAYSNSQQKEEQQEKGK